MYGCMGGCIAWAVVREVCGSCMEVACIVAVACVMNVMFI